VAVGRQIEREFLQQQRQLALRLGVPGEDELPTVGGRYMAYSGARWLAQDTDLGRATLGQMDYFKDAGLGAGTTDIGQDG
jgi:hypothetical protein